VVSTTVKLVKESGKSIPVIAGTGTNDTKSTVEKTKKAKGLGVDAVLVVNPYYNKPNQVGLTAHFTKVAEVGVPMVLYNIPGRTNINMTPATVAALYDALPMIIAIKEATGSLDQASEIAALCPGITILSGDDPLTLPLMSVGAKGVISVLSNMRPEKMLGVTRNVEKGDWAAARAQHLSNFALCKSLFVDPNPCPVKKAMAETGLIGSAMVRLPLVPSDAKTYAGIQAVLGEDKMVAGA